MKERKWQPNSIPIALASLAIGLTFGLVYVALGPEWAWFSSLIELGMFVLGVASVTKVAS